MPHRMTLQPFLVFDLDGTISDPVVGIGRSINYALAAFGYETVPEADISHHVGPPLEQAFHRLAPGAADDVIVNLVAKYRERYGDVGYSENVVYGGIPEALASLASLGVTMGVCTSKRVDFAERILSMFGLRDYFAFVSGGDIGIPKSRQLRTLLVDGAIDEHAVMIGDRAVDVTAARSNGLRAVGVLWGHGTREELDGAGPDHMLECPTELSALPGRLVARTAPLVR